MVADKEPGVWVDSDRVHPIGHEGEWFKVPGHALAHPGPQGTPYLFQAGASSRGQAFSLDHAEAIFFSSSTPQLVRRWVDGVREGLVERGRSADAVRILTIATVIVAETDEEAQARVEEYRQHVDIEGALALFGGWAGVDLSGLDPDATLEHVQTEANHSALASFTTLSSGRKWTVRDLAEFVAIGGRGPVIAGSPTRVVDELERWREESGVNGFNITAAVRPADIERFVDLVTPELRRRGLLLQAGGDRESLTLREALAGAGPRLPCDVLGATFRLAGAFARAACHHPTDDFA